MSIHEIMLMSTFTYIALTIILLLWYWKGIPPETSNWTLFLVILLWPLMITVGIPFFIIMIIVSWLRYWMETKGK